MDQQPILTVQIRSGIPHLHEIDCIVENGSKVTAVEIKSSTTMNSDFFKGLQYWQNLAGSLSDHSVLVYGGTEKQQWSKGQVIGWKSTHTIFDF